MRRGRSNRNIFRNFICIPASTPQTDTFHSPADSQKNIPGVAQATHIEKLLTSHLSIWSAMEILGHL